MLTCAMQKSMGGFCGMSKSLGRAPQPMANVRLKPLGSLGMDRDLTIHGDEATVSLLSSLDILWGADVPTVWDMPADAVSWRWNVRTGVLTTVHADGNETTRIARTWQSLAVAVDVLESHAFVYFFDAASYASAFLVASRELSARRAWSILLLWGEAEKYLIETFHIFSRACRTGFRLVKCPRATIPFRMSRTANRKCRKIARWKSCANGCLPKCGG